MSNGVNIQHALNGDENKLMIDNKTYKVDGFCEETNTVYEFYGCFWHGCKTCYKTNIVNSKNQKGMGTLNDLTVEKRDTIKNAGYNHVSTYECQLAKTKISKNSLRISLRRSSNHLIREMPFMVGEPMQPNSCTTSKKTSVVVTLTFAVSIQQYSTTKNIQLVTLPKYSTLKSMTNLGTVLLNAKSWLQGNYIIPFYHKESR